MFLVDETLSTMKIIRSKTCSFRKTQVKTLEHLFAYYEISEKLWIQISFCIKKSTKKSYEQSINYSDPLIDNSLCHPSSRKASPLKKMNLHDHVKMEICIPRMKGSEE